MHTRIALLLVVALAAGVALVGCKKTPPPEESAAPPAGPAAPAPREHATKAPTETMSGPNGEQGARPGGESGPGRFRMPPAEPLKTASGEAITLFGPAGTAALRMIVRGETVVEGDNTKGVLKSKSRDGAETSLSYEAASHTAESLGAAAPDGLAPASAFTVTGSVPEETVRASLERFAQMGGESQPKVTVSPDDCKVNVEVAVYLVDGAPEEVANKWAAAAQGGMDVMARGEGAICRSKTDPRVMVSITKVPDADSKLQVTVVRALQLPKDRSMMMRGGGPGGGGQRGMGGPGGGMGVPGGGQRGMGGQGGGQGRPGGRQGGNGGGGR